MKNKKIRKLIILTVVIIYFFIIYSHEIYAAVNTEYGGQSTSVSEVDLESVMTSSNLLDIVANFIYAVGSFLENITSRFSGMVTNVESFPWADKIIFNAIPFLDINFFNPSVNSLFSNSSGSDTTLAGIVKTMYYTIFTIAISFLAISVAIMAIRIATTAIAAEKAKYKESIKNWLYAIIMMFAMHYLIAFIFFTNEKMVEMASNILASNSKNLSTSIEYTQEENKTLIWNFVDAQTDVIENYWSQNKGSGASGVVADGTSSETIESINYGDDDHPGYHMLIDGEKNKTKAAMMAYLLRSDYKDSLYAMKDRSDDELPERGIIGTLAFQVFSNADKNVGEFLTFIDESFPSESQATRAATAANMLKDDVNLMCMLYNRSITPGQALDNVNTKASPTKWASWLACNSTMMQKIYDHQQITTDDTNHITNYDELANIYHKYLLKGNNIADTSSSSSIASLGDYFKTSAWYIELDSGEWTASDVTISGAILYTTFVIQSLLYLFAYVKRFFYIIILAMMAPGVVIYDFINKSMS